MTPEEELNQKYTIHQVVDEAVRNANHYDRSSTESGKQIAVLQTNQKFMLEEIQETKELVKLFNEKLDRIMQMKTTQWTPVTCKCRIDIKEDGTLVSAKKCDTHREVPEETLIEKVKTETVAWEKEEKIKYELKLEEQRLAEEQRLLEESFTPEGE